MPPAVAGSRGQSSRQAEGLVLPIFATALFASAFLLFAVQPMFAKMILPVLGGTPAVWSVAMVFFQSMLLLGYIYAHLLTRFAPPALAAGIHIGLMLAVAVAALPIAMPAGLGDPPVEGSQALWLLMVFAMATGLPFFAVSANAPLLQAWYARTHAGRNVNPYVLYGASNLGSFAALVSYPFLIEPWMRLADQSANWGRGFIGLTLLIAAAAALKLVLRQETAAAVSAPAPARTESAVTWPDRLRWTVLAFVPSGYLVAVTAHISQDLAAAPLLWILPLALFLLTFVVTFREGTDRRHAQYKQALPFAAVAVVGLWSLGPLLSLPIWLSLALHVGLFFLAALVVHGELYRRRPAASDLTEFYLWMSFGGVLGGVFCGLLAPHIFNRVLEYPILIVAAVASAGSLSSGVLRRHAKALAGPIVLGGLAGLAVSAGLLGAQVGLIAFFAVMTLLSCSLLARRDLALFAGLLGAALIIREAAGSVQDTSASIRSFFGVHRVIESPDGRLRQLAHGTTIHGVEEVRGADGAPISGRPRPLAYFAEGTPYQQAFDDIRAKSGGSIGRVGIVGLGMGALACRSVPNENWTYFEIDPEVIRIALDTSLFRSLRVCGGDNPDIVVGDARLTLARDRGGFGLIALDAFSSDAIPVHLLTREAFGVYLGKLAPGGVILSHISNRHMDLAEIVARVAGEHGLVTYLGELIVDPAESASGMVRSSSRLLAIARSADDLGGLTRRANWRLVPVHQAMRPWTDDYSNIIAPVWKNYSGRTFRAVE